MNKDEIYTSLCVELIKAQETASMWHCLVMSKSLCELLEEHIQDKYAKDTDEEPTEYFVYGPDHGQEVKLERMWDGLKLSTYWYQCYVVNQLPAKELAWKELPSTL